MEPNPVQDDAGAQNTLRETHDRQLPDGLLKELHAANGRADELRKQLEQTLGDADYDHETRAGRVGEDLRKAEREIEEITGRIRDATPSEAKGEA